jgi:hypothetical protein
MGEKIVRVKAHSRRAPRERESKKGEKSLIERAAEDTYRRLTGRR